MFDEQLVAKALFYRQGGSAGEVPPQAGQERPIP